MNTNIEISHITKKYKNGVTALDDVSFRVGSGVFGLLGHNGAGKTTLMKALVTVLTPSAGTIRICGFDMANNLIDTKPIKISGVRICLLVYPICRRSK